MSKFEVGDKVIAPRLWVGERKITSVNTESKFSIAIEDDDNTWTFCSDGMYDATDFTPSLYHAGTKITIEEAQPVRWPWVNVYKGDSGVLFCGNSVQTKDEALENIAKHWNYVCTTQLTPPEE